MEAPTIHLPMHMHISRSTCTAMPPWYLMAMTVAPVRRTMRINFDREPRLQQSRHIRCNQIRRKKDGFLSNRMNKHHHHNYHHHHWTAVVSRGWEKASACRLQVSMSGAVLCHMLSLQHFSSSSLHRLAGLPCRIFLSYGLQVVTREVHRSSWMRLICPAQGHFIFLTVLIIYVTFVLSLTQMLVSLSLNEHAFIQLISGLLREK